MAPVVDLSTPEPEKLVSPVADLSTLEPHRLVAALSVSARALAMSQLRPLGLQLLTPDLRRYLPSRHSHPKGNLITIGMAYHCISHPERPYRQKWYYVGRKHLLKVTHVLTMTINDYYTFVFQLVDLSIGLGLLLPIFSALSMVHRAEIVSLNSSANLDRILNTRNEYQAI